MAACGGASLKRIGNASCSVVEAVEVVGSLGLNGLEMSPRGNKWCPAWRELVAILSSSWCHTVPWVGGS